MRTLGYVYNVASTCSPDGLLSGAVIDEVGLAARILNKLRGAYQVANEYPWEPLRHGDCFTDVVLAGGALRSWFLEGSTANDLDYWVHVPHHYVTTGEDGSSELTGTFYDKFMQCFEGAATVHVLGDKQYHRRGMLKVVEVTLEGHPPVQIIFYSREGGLLELLHGFSDNLSTQAMLYSEVSPVVVALETSLLYQVYVNQNTKALQFTFEEADDYSKQIDRLRYVTARHTHHILPRYGDLEECRFLNTVNITLPLNGVDAIV